KETEVSKLLYAVRTHPAFSEFRETGKVSREKLVTAMLSSKVCLGADTKTRGTVQNRLKFLFKAVEDESTHVQIKKVGNRYLAYLTQKDNANKPSPHSKSLASCTESQFDEDLPQLAKLHEQNSIKPAENLHANLPPL